MSRDHEAEVAYVGCAFVVLALLTVLFLVLPLLEELSSDPGELQRDSAEHER